MPSPLIRPIKTQTPTVVAVETSTTVVLATNPSRGYALFVNNSNQDMYLGLGADAVMNQGIRINANGGRYEINDTNLFTGAVNAIASGGAKSLVVTEGI